MQVRWFRWGAEGQHKNKWQLRDTRPGFICQNRGRRRYFSIPADIEHILNHLGLKLFKVVHYDNELNDLCTPISTESWTYGTYNLPCSVALYVYQAFSSSISYTASDVVGFRLMVPSVNNCISIGPLLIGERTRTFLRGGDKSLDHGLHCEHNARAI